MRFFAMFGSWLHKSLGVAKSDRRPTRLAVEALEDRSLPSSLFQLSALAASSSTVSGNSLNVAVIVRDSLGGLATNYTGTIHFTSSDGAASLPTDYTFTASDSGSRTFSVTLRTLGAQTVTVTDTADSTLAAQAAQITEFPLPTPNSNPESIDTGSDGNLWYFGLARVGRVTPTGAITEFPLPLPNSGISYSALGADGNLWFTDSYYNAIGRITPSGSLTEFAIPTTVAPDPTNPLGSSNPIGITAGPDGNLWFTEEYGRRIGRVTPGGTITEFPITTFIAPYAITTGPDGNLWFTSDGVPSLGRISPDGSTITTFPLPASSNRTEEITTGPDGNLWFTIQSNSSIGRITPAGVVAEFPLTIAGHPFGITNYQGQLWFTLANHEIERISTDGIVTPVTSLSKGIELNFITPGPDGNLWFTEQLGNKVGRLVPTITVTPPPPLVFATGTDAGTVAQVNVYDASTQKLKFTLFPMGTFTGGVRVATADVNGDGTPDVICGAGPGGGPQVTVYDGKTGRLLTSFYAFGGATAAGISIGGNTAGASQAAAVSGFTGGVFVAGGDVNGDGFADIIVGADAGASPQVQVFDGRTGALIANFYAFGTPFFRGGVRVAAGDVNGDGKADIILAAGRGGGPQVEVYDVAHGGVLADFYAFGAPGFTGGVYVAAGDVNGDGKADIICGAGAGGGPMVSVYNGVGDQTLLDFYAYTPIFRGGVRVGARDLNGDGRADVLTTPGTGAPSAVLAFDSRTLGLLASFYAYAPEFQRGAYVG